MPKVKNSSNPHPLVDLLLLLIVLAAVAAVWGLAGNWIDINVKGTVVSAESDAQARGLFGDKFGAVNALFSGFAFAGIIFTILLQRRDLQQTRSAFEDQTETANLQRFDSTFFRLLALHNDITFKLDDLGNKGRSSFEAFIERVKAADKDFPVFMALSKLGREEVRTIRDGGEISIEKYPMLTQTDVENIRSSLASGKAGCDNFLEVDIETHEKKIRDAYTKVAEEHIDRYSHYFRNLYHLLRFIDETELIEDAHRERYVKFVRSQLSEIELVSLFYNALIKIEIPGRESMELGFPKMGALLNKYRVLHNMSPRSLIHPVHAKIFEKNNGASV